ncbi:MAG: hypothetical protein JXB35_09945 [Anaerolineae bacterium]|nr:hypothetical protein [Anaerolineae bacterium]
MKGHASLLRRRLLSGAQAAARGIVVSLLLIAGACAPVPVDEPSPIPTSTTPAGAGETAAPPATVPLLRDDFSSNGGGWTLFDTPEGAAFIQQGELYLEDRGRGVGVYSQPVGQSWDDVTVNVLVRQIEGSQDNWMGVICRQQSEENYYLFAISADGYYLILKVENGLPMPLAGPALSEAINPGRATNQIEARCDGTILTLNINNSLFVSRADATFSRGAIAVFTDAVAGGATTAAFDSFTLLQP